MCHINLSSISIALLQQYYHFALSIFIYACLSVCLSLCLFPLVWLYLFLYLNSGLGRRYLTAITCFNALVFLISKVRSNSIICLPYSILLNELFGPHTQSHRKTPNEEEEDEGKKQPLFANIKAYKVRSNEKLFFSHMSPPACHRVFPIPFPFPTSAYSTYMPEPM